MSEQLKSYKMIDESYCDDSFCVVPSDVYLKSEVDEELAKLNRQVKFLQTTHSSCNECNKCAEGMGRVFDESLAKLKKDKAYLLEHTTKIINSQERVIHRQKYKRCLAMARYCRSVWSSIIFIHEGNGAGRYMKWEQRWLKLANNFDPNNSTAH